MIRRKKYTHAIIDWDQNGAALRCDKCGTVLWVWEWVHGENKRIRVALIDDIYDTHKCRRKR